MIPKISLSQNSRNTYKPNLTCACIFLSVRPKLLLTFQYEIPCICHSIKLPFDAEVAEKILNVICYLCRISSYSGLITFYKFFLWLYTYENFPTFGIKFWEYGLKCVVSLWRHQIVRITTGISI